MLFLKLIVKEHTDTILKESEDYFELSPSFSVIKEKVFGKYKMKVEGVLDEHGGMATVDIPEHAEAYIVNEEAFIINEKFENSPVNTQAM